MRWSFWLWTSIILKKRCWLPVAGYWLLVTGCRLLVTGCWLLVTSYRWVLTDGFNPVTRNQ
ncbi:MAG: hypothetical protein EHM75_01220 [Desulfobacteraceae bacterium]|nr:MAG: hypothetical protein EHM75_01220 [Desulfobacteraceae bacterium]